MPPPKADRARPPSLTLLAAVTALGFCALHMVVPALPLLVAAFDMARPGSSLS